MCRQVDLLQNDSEMGDGQLSARPEGLKDSTTQVTLASPSQVLPEGLTSDDITVLNLLVLQLQKELQAAQRRADLAEKEQKQWQDRYAEASKKTKALSERYDHLATYLAAALHQSHQKSKLQHQAARFSSKMNTIQEQLEVESEGAEEKDSGCEANTLESRELELLLGLDSDREMAPKLKASIQGYHRASRAVDRSLAMVPHEPPPMERAKGLFQNVAGGLLQRGVELVNNTGNGATLLAYGAAAFTFSYLLSSGRRRRRAGGLDF